MCLCNLLLLCVVSMVCMGSSTFIPISVPFPSHLLFSSDSNTHAHTQNEHNSAISAPWGPDCLCRGGGGKNDIEAE